MRSCRRQFVLLGVAILLTCALVHGQVKVTPEMPLTADGFVSTEFLHSSQTNDLDNVNLGVGGDLKGYYHNPAFLQFGVSPYYELGRQYSDTSFHNGGQGIGASLNAFDGGLFPLSITYHRARTTEATYNVLGAPGGIGGDGTSQDLSINWTLRFRKLPTVQLGYLNNGGDFTVLGSDAHGESHGRGFSISTQYRLAGFSLMAGYDTNKLDQILPDLFSSPSSSIDTHQKNLRFGVSRNLWHSTYFDSTAERSHWISDATGRKEDRTYDTAPAGVSTSFTSKLSSSFRVNYSSDLTGLRLASLVSGGTPGDPGTLFPVLLDAHFRTVTFNEGMTYALGHGFRLQGGAQQGSASSPRGKIADTSNINGQVSYMHPVYGGSFMAGYGLAHTSIDNRFNISAPQLRDWSGSTIGHSGNLGYSHHIGQGQYAGSLHYSQSESQTPLLLNSRSYGGEISAENMVYGWRLRTAVRLDKINVESLTSTSSLQKLFRVAVAKGRFNAGFTQQFTDGLSIFSLNGVHPVSPTDLPAVGGILDTLLSPTASKATSLTGTYVASKRLEFDVNWIRSQFETLYSTAHETGINDQFDFIVKYRFRQLDCRAGYRRYFQQFSGITSEYNANTVYFQVSRRFHLF